jgi:hypothetical protein
MTARPALLAFIACVASGCKGGASARSEPAAPVPEADEPAGLFASAATAREALLALESASGPAGWSHGLGEGGPPWTGLAAAAAPAALEGLVRALWRQAAASPGGEVSAATIDEAAAGLELAGAANKPGALAWRAVLAAIEGEIVLAGGAAIEPLTDDGARALAAAAAAIAADLQTRAAAAAESAGSPAIDLEHLEVALAQLAERATLEPRTPPASAASIEAAISLTRARIADRARVFSRRAIATGDLRRDLAAAVEMPVAADVGDRLYELTESFIAAATSGAVLRADNLRPAGSAPAAADQRYLRVLEIHGVLEQLLPHSREGDAIAIRLEPDPSAPDQAGFATVTLEVAERRVAAVRASAVTWRAMAAAIARRPFALDPFAAEYLAEVAAIRAAALLEHGARLAREQKAAVLDADTLARAAASGHIAVPRRPEEPAPPELARLAARRLEGYGEPLFVDASAESGLPVEVPATAGPELDPLGGGVAVGDLDLDGYPDLFIGGDVGRLYLNKGETDQGAFVEAGARLGLGAPVTGARAAVFYDLEGDGDLDLLIIRGEGGSALYRQDGGKLAEVAADLGLETGAGAHAATVFDYDGDGDLDLYIGHRGEAAAANQLWKWDQGRYHEVAAAAGVDDRGWTTATTILDRDDDGRPDLHVVNQLGADALYRNKGDGTFVRDRDAGEVWFDGGRGAAAALADVDGDGRWDLYLAGVDPFVPWTELARVGGPTALDLAAGATPWRRRRSGEQLWLSGGDSIQLEPGARGWCWGAAFLDVDNDADDDLYIATGYVPGTGAASQPNQLLLAIGDGFYAVAGRVAGAAGFSGESRALGIADFDRDGDLDLVVSGLGAPPRLLENRRQGGNWIRLELAAGGANPLAIGARITVELRGRTALRQIAAGGGYLSQTEAPVHLGLGSARTVDVTVRWPDGAVTEHRRLRANRAHRLERRAP